MRFIASAICCALFTKLQATLSFPRAAAANAKIFIALIVERELLDRSDCQSFSASRKKAIGKGNALESDFENPCYEVAKRVFWDLEILNLRKQG
jgi:hypothetical protein